MFGIVPSRREKNGGRALTRADNPYALFRQEFDTLFDRVFGRMPMNAGWENGWGLDVEDKEKEYCVRAEAPGFEAKDFDIQLMGDQLVIRAEEKKETKEGEAKGVEHRTFERWVTLPGGTDPNKVEARYRNGVLEIHLPKTPEAQARRIEVKA
jgi:HSP20 family protein